jgi:agmatine/peptidylarginine deiminase
VDNFVTFVAADVVVVAAGDRARDAEAAAALDRNAEVLSRVLTRHGPLRVERVPMPAFTGDACRSYTNVIYANGALLVPHYPGVDAALEREMLATYRRLLAGWELIQVDSGPLMAGRGGLRCLSAHVPWLHDRFEQAGTATRRQARKIYAR